MNYISIFHGIRTGNISENNKSLPDVKLTIIRSEKIGI